MYVAVHILLYLLYIYHSSFKQTLTQEIWKPFTESGRLFLIKIVIQPGLCDAPTLQAEGMRKSRSTVSVWEERGRGRDRTTRPRVRVGKYGYSAP